MKRPHADAARKWGSEDGCAHAPMGENCHACVDPGAACDCDDCRCFWPANAAAAKRDAIARRVALDAAGASS